MDRRVAPEIARTVVAAEAIAARVRALGAQITRDYADALTSTDADGHASGGLVLVPVLTGAFMFLADLVRELPHKIRIEVVTVSSYPGASMVSRGASIVGILPSQLEGRHVLIVDDVLDSGQTLALLREEILRRHPKSLRTCVLLRKEVPRAKEIDVDYVGFDIPDEFVVGYGLDHDGFYRNLPYIAAVGNSASARDEPTSSP